MYPNPVRDAYRVFHPKIEPSDRVSPKAIGIRLKTRVGEPVKGDGETLILGGRRRPRRERRRTFSGSRRRRTPRREADSKIGGGVEGEWGSWGSCTVVVHFTDY